MRCEGTNEESTEDRAAPGEEGGREEGKGRTGERGGMSDREEDEEEEDMGVYIL